MQTMERTVPSKVAVSKLNPSVYLTAMVVVGTIAVLFSSSTLLAGLWVVAIGAVWILMETLATTVFLHRTLTHGALNIRSKSYERLWLWFVRSGMVNYWEWVENHAAHHALTDTPQDSYTPRVRMELIDTPPLPAPRPWRFWQNAQAYTRTSNLYRDEPLRLKRLAEAYKEVRAALERLEALKWAREVYGNVNRGLFINLALFAVAALPLAISLGGWLIIPTLVLVPAATALLKEYLYLLGGYIINYFGHQAEDEKHQSDIPWYLMVITLAMLGEGWHEFHHDAPYSARFHSTWDPGWWVICVSAKLKLVGTVVVAEEEEAHRRYHPRLLID
jgi:stearoyl-CoA desaturase (Delta-9 desaturase)